MSALVIVMNICIFILFSPSLAFSNCAFLTTNHQRRSIINVLKDRRNINSQKYFESSYRRGESSPTTHLFSSSPLLENVGVVGKGYVCALTAKLAALSGYKTWMLHSDDEEEMINKLLKDDEDTVLEDLTLVPVSEPDLLESKLGDVEALIIATDNPDAPMNESVIKYLFDKSTSIKKIILMSRNLNLRDMGFFVKASKVGANREVWHPRDDLVQKYRSLENIVKEIVSNKNDDVSYTFIRAGTLKGGGCGSEPAYPKYLTKEFYAMTKKDIISWNMLFDCETRNVKLYKGDTMPGPGTKAVFTANSYEECQGDTGRVAIAECMVRALSRDDMRNIDFAVGTKKGTDIHTDLEWEELFKDVLS